MDISIRLDYADIKATIDALIVSYMEAKDEERLVLAEPGIRHHDSLYPCLLSFKLALEDEKLRYDINSYEVHQLNILLTRLDDVLKEDIHDTY